MNNNVESGKDSLGPNEGLDNPVIPGSLKTKTTSLIKEETRPLPGFTLFLEPKVPWNLDLTKCQGTGKICSL